MLIPSIFVLTIFAGKAHAQVVGTLRVGIPFSFYAGNAKLPAGKYRIHMVSKSGLHLMEIRSADDSMSALFTVHAAEANSNPPKNELIFDKYGSSHVLAKVFDDHSKLGGRVVGSGYEGMMSRQGGTPTEQTVPAYHEGEQGS